MNHTAHTPELSRFSAAVVGCGGLGTNAAVHLAGMGIGRLVLMDFDTVESGNLNRQFFYTAADVGRQKCLLLAARLAAYAPLCEVIPVQKKIRVADDLAQARDVDVVISAVDTIAARRVLNDFCKRQNIPLVNGGVDGFYGTAYVYMPGKVPDLDDAGLLASVHKAPVSLSSTVGMIGALQAQLAAQTLSGSESCAGRLYILDNNEIHTINIR